MFKTQLCDLLEIEYPIIQGGMVWVSYHELCAAVSVAGGLGTLAAGSMTPEELRDQARLVRERTSKPFAVNVPIRKGDSPDLVRVAVEEKVPVITTSAGNPRRFTRDIQAEGIKVIHVSPSPALALKAAEAGVDAVVAEGIEAGGHDGFDEVTTMALVPQIVDLVEVPVIAAGGIGDSRGFVAALALGAKGVQMGTRFAATYEAMAHPKFKEAILKVKDTGTVITGRLLGPTRCARNRLTDRILEAERKGAPREEILELIGPGRSRRATVEGDVEEGTIYCGQIAALMGQLKRADEVISEIIQGAETLLRALDRLQG